MKKSANEVIEDLRKIFKTTNRINFKDSYESNGQFLIFKDCVKNKKVKKKLNKYFDKVKIKDGSLKMIDKTLVYTHFNIISDDTKNKIKGKEKGQKEKEESPNKKNKKSKSKKPF